MIFLLAFFSIGLGVILAIAITRQKLPAGTQLVPPEDDYDHDPKTEPTLTLATLYRLGEQLCEENGLKIKERFENEDNEIYWITESANEFFFGNYVLGFYQATAEQPFVSLAQLLEFKDFVKSVGSSKGFYFTTGYFTRDVHQPLEGAKVTLYNRAKILSELKRFKIGF